MKIRELKDEPLIRRIPVDNDSYNRTLPDNRINVGGKYKQPGDVDKNEFERMKKLAGITMGSGNEKGDKHSPLTHGASDKGEYQQKHSIEPGTDEWFKLWLKKPAEKEEDAFIKR